MSIQTRAPSGSLSCLHGSFLQDTYILWNQDFPIQPWSSRSEWICSPLKENLRDWGPQLLPSPIPECIHTVHAAQQSSQSSLICRSSLRGISLHYIQAEILSVFLVSIVFLPFSSIFLVTVAATDLFWILKKVARLGTTRWMPDSLLFVIQLFWAAVGKKVLFAWKEGWIFHKHSIVKKTPKHNQNSKSSEDCRVSY